MTTNEIREKYLRFFRARGHRVIPSASLVPENDPTTLFTGSGMQPMIQYLLGAPHPEGRRIADAQKCFRAQDIDEVGDNRHTTFFEMLGNWSLGDYFKEDQLRWLWTFLTEEIGLAQKRLFVTVFRGNKEIPRDTESVRIWQTIFAGDDVSNGDQDFAEQDGMKPGSRIFYYDESKNWWSRAGEPKNMPAGEPGGPDSEVFWDFGVDLKLHERSAFAQNPCHVNCDCGRFLEIGNSVFMEYKKTANGFEPLAQKNVDFGGGLERIAAAKGDNPDMFQIDLLRPVVLELEKLSGKKYGGDEETTRAMRVVTDHLRAAAFILAAGVSPSNTDRGYVARRLIRRAIRHARRLGIQRHDWIRIVAETVFEIYYGSYPDLSRAWETVVSGLKAEEEKFSVTCDRGLKELERYARETPAGLSGRQIFTLFTTYGFPIELTREVARERGLPVNESDLEREMAKHREISRSTVSGKFKGGLADRSEEVTKLHTATHLLNEALRRVLGPEVKQRGSNITRERLRFDFNFGRKMTDEEVREAERIVNNKIKEALAVTRDEMPLAEAVQSGAEQEFGARYPDRVTVYSIGDFSKEICGGPHVANTRALGRFKILKEEAVGAGIRRIRAVLKT